MNIPFLPLSVTIERRRLGRPGLRTSLRGLMVLTLGLALYLACVTLPARRERFARADRAIRDQMALLRRAAAEDRERERSLRTRHAKDLACADAEEKEAAKCPAGSADAQSHRELARLWLDAARRVPLGNADAAARRAQAIEAWMKWLEQTRRTEEISLSRLETFAGKVRELPTTPEWTRLSISDRIAEVETAMRAERSGNETGIRTILATGP